MSVRLSDEQRNALAASSERPLTVEDEQSRKVYYLLNEESFLHLRGLQAEHERECQQRLRRLIEEGIQSTGVPGNEAFARLRELADEFSRNSP